jgi:hypothetical protein
MKKFTVLVALILCVAIGGVYAAWVYPNLDNNITLDRNITVQMSAADTTNNKGVLSALTGNSGMSFFLDDEGHDYVADVKLSGYFEFLFTPDADLPDDAKGPLNLKYTLSFTPDNVKYGNELIVSIVDGKATGFLEAKEITTANFANGISPHGTDLSEYIDKGLYYYYIDAATLAGTFEAMTAKLDTLEKYNEVKSLITPLQLVILLEDADYVAP